MKKKCVGLLPLYCFVLALVFSGCSNSPDGEEIPDPPQTEIDEAMKETDGSTNNVVIVKGMPAGYYKLYVNVSDSMDPAVRHVAQGTVLIEGKDAVAVKLWEPIEGTDPSVWRGKDPDQHGASRWTGKKGQYYSITVAKEYSPDMSYIQAWGSMSGIDLTTGNQSITLGSGTIPMTSTNTWASKVQALYDDVIRNDNDPAYLPNIRITE